MSGEEEEDWEKLAEDENALNKLNENKTQKFVGEDDLEQEIKKQKLKEEQKKKDQEQEALTAQQSAENKKKTGKKTYDEMFEERISGGKSKNVNQKQIKGTLTKEQISMEAEQDITEALFSGIGITSSQLKSQPDYTNFAKKVGQTLYQGEAPYRIPDFFKELIRDIGKQCDSGEIKDVLDSMTALYNEKVKQEKTSGTQVKKQTTKPTLKTAVATNMKQMGLEEYGDEDDYYNEDYYGEEDAEYNDKNNNASKGLEKPKATIEQTLKSTMDFPTLEKGKEQQQPTVSKQRVKEQEIEFM